MTEKEGLPLGKIEQIAVWWIECSYRVVFTGAGISTESGLADYRSPRGLWRGIDPRKVATISALYNNPGDFYDYYRMRLPSMGKAEPNQGHRVLAQLQHEMLLNAIITQNVDSLHQKAGASRVIELHGNLREASCMKCKKIYPIDVLLPGEGLPKCKDCNGLLKPNVILFGESLPHEALRQAEMESKRAQLFVVIGSSLEVSPANHFPLMARDKGAKLVIINREPTVMDQEADLVLNGSAGEILTHLYDSIIDKKGTGKGVQLRDLQKQVDF